ncbi:MAG: S1 RNA-binding domain-containing protein [Clostridia bacterium]|nr:S1 RNA-binding domain-containing protein [Clostridia bacterium]
MAEKNFEELYNESLNTKKFNKTVTGTVIQISRKGEIFVDFKYKADGIIPIREYSDDENKNPRDEFKPGDTIRADVLKWNDGLGNVLLSYKNYKKREEAEKEKALKIKQAKEIEAQKKERAKNIQDFWNNIKIGKTYTGTISKIADYGIFVDLGLAKGLAHKSELLWDKNEKLENKFNINDEIEVKIKDFDKEEKRISLEYPLKGENPWFALADKYKITDIVTCKVAKFASFGAFLEIEKGLEGLVHNSEITGLKRVIKAEDELQLGQTVNAKIINIDREKLKISLSIKELEGTSAEYGYEEYIKPTKG